MQPFVTTLLKASRRNVGKIKNLPQEEGEDEHHFASFDCNVSC
jgi:hypothetical protein